MLGRQEKWFGFSRIGGFTSLVFDGVIESLTSMQAPSSHLTQECVRKQEFLPSATAVA